MDHADGALAATADAPGIARTRAVVASAVTLLDKDRQTNIRFSFLREPVATAAHFKGGMRGDVDIVDHPVSTLTLGPRRDAETIAPQGLPASAMDHRQRDMLFDLVLEWAASSTTTMRRHVFRRSWRDWKAHRILAPGARRRPDHACPHDRSRSPERLRQDIRLMAPAPHPRRRARSFVPAITAGWLALMAPAVACAAAPAAPCETMAKLALPDATITAAETMAAGHYRMPDGPLARLASFPGMNVAGRVEDGPNPAFCRVAATLRPTGDSDIRIEVWLPLSGWNGKFLGVGNFGWAGSLMPGGMLSGIAEGYAAASTDTGHDGQGGGFALGHPEKLVDYAYRADHLMTLDARAIVQAFYGTAPTRSYWVGCSLGGLEGLIEAKRYPDDYDGIVAGAPPNPIVDFNAAQLWPSWLVNHLPDASMPKAKFTMLGEAVRKACASPVGLKQGFVDEPDRCGFEPRQLLCKGLDASDCLTASQVRLMERIYAGPVDPRTGAMIFPGPAKGGEGELAMFADRRPFPVALDLFRYAAFQNPTWDGTTIDWDKDIAAATAKLGPLLHVDADLKPFFDHGGKVLLYIGWNDYHNPTELIGYYGAVMRHAGPQARDSARLFTIPGMGHCFGGAGCDTFDKLGTIDAWVDQGRTPGRVVASKVEDGKVVRTRPLCAYPDVARYVGSGDIDVAASFACSAD